MKLNQINDTGFSLLEVLFAMTVFSIGLLAILMMVFTVTNCNSASKNLTSAVNLAQSKIDDLKITAYASILDETETSLDASGVSGSGIFNRATTVTTSTSPNYKTVDVTVSWTTSSRKQVSLKTIIAQ